MKSHWVVSILALASLCQGQSDTPFALYEVERGGQTIPVRPPNIVDVDSRLKLSWRAIPTPSDSPEVTALIDRAQKLRNLASEGVKALPELVKALNDPASTLAARNAAYQRASVPIAIAARQLGLFQTIADAARIAALELPGDANLARRTARQYELSYRAIADEADRVTAEINRLLNDPDTRIVLTTVLYRDRTRREKLPIEQFTPSIPLGQLQQLSQLGTMIGDNPELSLDDILSQLGEPYRKQLEAFAESIETRLQKYGSVDLITGNQDLSQFGAPVVAAKATLDASLTALSTSIVETKTTFAGASLATLPQIAPIQLQRLITGTNDVVAAWNGLILALKNQGSTGATQLATQLTNLKVTFDADVASVTAEGKSILNALSSIFTIAKDLQEISRKAREYTLATLRDEPDLMAGEALRDGDEIEVYAERGATGIATLVPYGDRQRVHVYRVGLYTQTSTLLVFTKQSDSDNFRLGGAVSQTFKSGNRSSLKWNDGYNVGLGYSVVAMDSDGDSTIELGIGLVFTLLDDRFQIGYGLNVNRSEGFFYFGIRVK